MNESEKRKFKIGILFAASVIVLYAFITNIGAFGGFLASLITILSPLLTGVLLSLILGTPMRLIEGFFEFLNRKSKFKKKLSEGAITLISLTITYLLAVGAISFVVVIIVPAISESVSEIKRAVTELTPKAISFAVSHGIDGDKINEIIEKIDLNQIWEAFTSNAGNIVNTLISSVNGIISILVNIVTSIIFSVYILANKKNLGRQSENIVNAYFPPKKAKKISYVLNLIIKTFSKFFSGQCLEAIILGTIFFIAMSIFKFPYAPIISLIIGITAFVPYVGAFIGCIIGTLLILLISPMKAVVFVIMFLIIQQLENNLIYPRVVGTSVGLPAMWTFAALIVGGAVYGVVGMLVFIPVTSVVYTLIKNDVKLRLSKKKESTEEKTAPDEVSEGKTDN